MGEDVKLSDADLDRIEYGYVERAEYPPAVDDIKALLAEVRRARYGRWERDPVSGSFYIAGEGDCGSTLYPRSGEMWHNVVGPAALTPEDYEAAAKLVRAARRVVPRGWQGETCAECRRHIPVGFAVPDEVWTKVVGDENVKLCLACFDARCAPLDVDWARDVELFPVSTAMWGRP